MLKRFLLSLLALLLLFEEWLWLVLTTLGRKLSQWLHLQKVEAWLRNASPRKALAAFFVPVAVVTPINLTGLNYIAKGLFLKGLMFQLVAKLFGTVLIARVFALTKPQLLTFGWFNWLYHTITKWLRWAHERIQQTTVYKKAKEIKLSLKALAQRIKAQISKLL